MWEKLNNSSLIFSRTFNNNNYSNFYKNRIFINRIYNYYVNKGYYNIIITQIVDFLISNFLVFFILFLVQCVEFDKLLNLSSKNNFVEYIDIKQLLNLNGYYLSLIIIFVVLNFIKIISLLDDIYIYSTIKTYFNNTLRIRDSDLQYYEWNDIIDIINDIETDEISVYYINTILTNKDNYFMLLLDNNILKPTYINNLYEWNLIYCIILDYLIKMIFCQINYLQTKKISRTMQNHV